MPDETLSPEKLKSLYARFDVAAVGWQPWFDRCLAEIRWAQAVPLDELRTLEGQRRLWSLRGISTLGGGDSMNIVPAIEDTELVQLLCSVRGRAWSHQVGKRAQEIQAVYDSIVERMSTLYESYRPLARLHRAMVALLPTQLHVGFSWDGHKTIRKLLIGQPQAKPLQAATLARERLRQVLGEEANLDEHVRRMLFCWWLHENAKSLDVDEVPVEPIEPKGGDDAPTEEPLEIWPYGKQYRGIGSVRGYVTAYRHVVQSAIGGKTQEEVVQTMLHDFEYERYWQPKSVRITMLPLVNLGMLRREGELYFPTDEGEELLETDPPDVLVHALLVRVYGFAQVLRALAAAPMAPADVASALRAEYPSWTKDRMAYGLLGWASSLGLAARDAQGRYALTEYGRAWASRLPGELPKPPASDPVDVSELDDELAFEVGPEPVARAAHPDLSTVWATFQRPPNDRLVFSQAQVRALHAAWTFHPRKRFAILSGLSGTGKTELLLSYGRIVCEHMGLDPNRHVRRVAVGPDWRDPTGLLGYFNALHAEPTFQAEPALRVVLDAVAHPDVPFFLVLDEMNLARVERYFAPFLSAMESAQDPWIQIHAHDEPINGVPPRVPWPANLRIGGTVNMDETTHPFSDKVLDRAFTLEFWEVDLGAFFGRQRLDSDGDAVAEVLRGLQDDLRPVRRHFGYRSAGEVLGWVRAARSADPSATLEDCLDQAVFSKILPRLRGTQSAALETALNQLHARFTARRMPLCAAKVELMRQRLLDTGVAGFWA